MKLYVYAFAASFVLSLVLCYIAVPILQRLKVSQTIHSAVSASHADKQGVATMGGLAFLAAAALCLLGCLFLWKEEARNLLYCLLCMLAFAALGFADDYLKVIKHRNEGLTVKQKFIPQCALALVFAFVAFRTHKDILLPFGGQLHMGLLYVPFIAFVLVAMDNSANLLDGLDGLLSSNSAIAFLFVAFYAVSRGAKGSAAVCVCMAGALIAFLAFNGHPAKVFMGDVGSLGVGAAMTAAAIVSDSVLVLPFACVTMLISSVSDIAQILYMRRHKGLKLLRMSPLHHHLQMGGMSETRVVTVYNLITVAGCLAALILFM